MHDYSEYFNRLDKQEKIKNTEETSSHVLNELKRDPMFKAVQNNNTKMNEIRMEFDQQHNKDDSNYNINNNNQSNFIVNNASELNNNL